MSDLPTPITREEQFLNGIAQGDTSNLPTPVGREEKYLDYIARNGGGGGGGTTNYNALDNKPQIAGTTLQGDKSLADLGIASASDVATALAEKVDKVAGKGLSTNDYSDTEKGKVAANASAIEAIVNEYGAKNLAPILDFTQKVDNDITWTVNRENGSNKGKVSVVGTASGWSIVKTKNFFLPARSYIINAGVSDIYHCYVQLNKVSDSSLIASTYGESSVLFELTNDAELTLTYVVYEGATVNDVFACMIRDARITDPTYAPYAMTNEQLTDAVNRGSVSVTSDGVKTYKQLFNELFALANYSRINANRLTVKLSVNSGVYSLAYTEDVWPAANFGYSSVYNNKVEVSHCRLHASDSVFESYYDDVIHDLTNEIAPSGRTFILYF